MPFVRNAEVEGSTAHEMFAQSSRVKRIGSLLLLLRAPEVESGSNDAVSKGIAAGFMSPLAQLFCSAVVSGVLACGLVLLE